MTKRVPDFENNLLKVLKGEKPERATLFELIIADKFYPLLAGHEPYGNSMVDSMRTRIDAMTCAGYDYIRAYGTNERFRKRRVNKETRSINGDSLIRDWESFEKYPWPDMANQDYSHFEKIKPYLPDGMKIMVMGPNGVFENVIDLVGYDNLCIMLYEDPELVKAIFDEVGSRLMTYYENSICYDTVGFICSNDDWGFNTQTFLSPADMRKYVFPWHKKIVDLAHANGKPCMLHSCGYYNEIIDDVIDIGFDARHSYEDNITPVEKAYEELNGKIAVLGGIDVDFLATNSPDEVYKRCRNMLELTADRGGYALGSGNSVTKYVPFENYLAMIRAAHEFN